jgi:hypothetical protein
MTDEELFYQNLLTPMLPWIRAQIDYNFALKVDDVEHKVCLRVFANAHGFSKTAFEQFALSKKEMKTSAAPLHYKPMLGHNIPNYIFNETKEIFTENVVGGKAGALKR